MISMSTVQWDSADNRIVEVSLVTLFLMLLLLLQTNATILFPDVALSISEMISFYFPATILSMVGVLYLHQGKRVKQLPTFPSAYLAIRRYIVGFLLSLIVVYSLLLFIDVSFTTFDYSFSVPGWILQLIVATMENLPFVVFMPVLFYFNLGGTGIKALAIEYIPSAIFAALAHFRVYYQQVQQTVATQHELGIDINSSALLAEYLIFAFIAFTIFYIVYKKLGFAYSVALHQVWNLLNSTGA